MVPFGKKWQPEMKRLPLILDIFRLLTSFDIFFKADIDENIQINKNCSENNVTFRAFASNILSYFLLTEGYEINDFCLQTRVHTGKWQYLQAQSPCPTTTMHHITSLLFHHCGKINRCSSKPKSGVCITTLKICDSIRLS